MTKKIKLDRRNFLKQAAGALGAATLAERAPASALNADPIAGKEAAPRIEDAGFPRRFRGRQLRMISFPLGGVAAGSIGLGGRGQLANWEIFNRPNKGYRPSYAFPSIWAQRGSEPSVTRVL